MKQSRSPRLIHGVQKKHECGKITTDLNLLCQFPQVLLRSYADVVLFDDFANTTRLLST
jgi:hypothetical protein